MTRPSSASDAVCLRRTVSMRITRARSLQATQAEVRSSATVIVGQNGPAAAQDLICVAPGRRGAAVACAGAARAAAAMHQRSQRTGTPR